MYEVYEKLLKEHGVSSYRVSLETGISQSVLSSWKSGVSQPKPDKLKKIADYFNVSVDYLMSGDESKIKQKTEYYLGDNASKVAQEMFDDSRIRGLNHIKKNITEEQFMAYYDMIVRLYQQEHPEDNYDFRE